MKCVYVCWLLAILCASRAAADEPKVMATKDLSAESDAAEAAALAKLRAEAGQKMEAESNAIRSAAAEQLERKLAEVAEEAKRVLAREERYLRARYAEERAGYVSLDPMDEKQMRVPRLVDRKQKSERMLLLLPNGPVVMQLEIFVDGKPLHEETEQIIDDMLAGADLNQDGQITWDEALTYPQFATVGSNAFIRRLGAAASSAEMLKKIDANGDGLVARAEARLFLAASGSRATFTAQSYNTGYVNENYGYRSNAVPLSQLESELLQIESDGGVSRQGLLSIAWRVLSHDCNDDAAVTVAEFLNLRQQPISFGMGSTPPPTPTLLFGLGPTTKWQELWQLLCIRYAENASGPISLERLSIGDTWIASLDKNDDQSIDQNELRELNQSEPHLVITAYLGAMEQRSTDEPRDRMTIETRLLQAKVTSTVGGIAVELPGVNLSLACDPTVRPTAGQGAESQVRYYLRRFDRNMDEVLDKTELVDANRDGGLGLESSLIDTNADGKISREELRTIFWRRERSQLSRISMASTIMEPPIFHVLDGDDDGQLGEREIHRSFERLAQFDLDGDGQLKRYELPVKIRLVLGRGASVYQYLTPTAGNLAVNPGGGAARNENLTDKKSLVIPAWFRAMDVNRDGEVGRREFIGPSSLFVQLDANSDGFIEPAEAAAGEHISDQQVAK